MNEEQFLIKLSRHCFRLAQHSKDTISAADFRAVGHVLLNRAHRDSSITSQSCAGAIMVEGEPDPCLHCSKPCIAAPHSAKR